MNDFNVYDNPFLRMIDAMDRVESPQSDGMSSSPYRPYDELSMRERAAVLRAGVQNGYRDIGSIRDKYNEFAEDGNLFGDGGDEYTARQDNTSVNLGIVPKANVEDDFYRNLMWFQQQNQEAEEKQRQEDIAKGVEARVEPYDVQAHRGWMEVSPTTGETVWHAPTTINVEPKSEGQRMWESPAFQMAIAPMFDIPFMFSGTNRARQAMNTVSKARKAYTAPRTIINNVDGNKIGISVKDYSMPEMDNFIKSYFSKMTIRGQKFDNSGNIVKTNRNVGFPKNVTDDLMHNTVERNIRQFKKENPYYEGYETKVRNLLDNAEWKAYPEELYKVANSEDYGGFYDPITQFISINEGGLAPKGKFTLEHILGHEGRHLIDYNTGLTDNQRTYLLNAYGDDFVNLPNTKYAGSLKGYTNMSKERVTTNRDARSVLLGPEKSKWDLHLQDKVIDRIDDSKIFEAVEKANGYGRRYIQYLRDNNLLTPEKAQEFREAMKHVGSYVLPIGTATGYGLRNHHTNSKQ